MDIRLKTFEAAKDFSCGRAYRKGAPVTDPALIARLLRLDKSLLKDTTPPPNPPKKEES